MNRLSWSDKRAVVLQLQRLGAGHRPLAGHIDKIAAKHGVSKSAVYRWLHDPTLIDGTAPPPRKRFEPTINHLTVLANERTMHAAWLRMHQAGVLDCSYPTFARAIAERADPTLVRAAIDGHPGLINNRLYLSWTAPHRGHTIHVDHTTLDLWVWPSHRHRSPIKPHATSIVDNSTGLLHVVPWVGDVNGDMFAAALADYAVQRNYFGVTVGGQPEQIVVDNAASHFAAGIRAGIEELGWIEAPTNTYSSFQNGPAENANAMLATRFAARAPGATKAGKTRNGSPRHAARLPDDIKPEQVWSWKAFKLGLAADVDIINTTLEMSRHGHRTRLQAWKDDPTELRPLTQDEARVVMLPRTEKTYTATKNGLSFDNVNYVDAKLKFGHQYYIRYWPTQRDFIEVYDLHGAHVTVAYDNRNLPKKKHEEFMAHRARQERDALAIEHGVQDYRRRQAAHDNAAAEQNPPADGPAADTKPSGTNANNSEASPQPDPGECAAGRNPIVDDGTAVGRLRRAHGENADGLIDLHPPVLPRLPVTPAQPPQAATPGALDRLRQTHGQDLPELFRRAPTGTADGGPAEPDEVGDDAC